MIVAVLAAVLPVLLATGIVLAPGVQGRRFGPARTFALFAALAVVLAELLPRALHALGLGGLVVFGIGLLLPRVVDAALRRAGADAPAGLTALLFLAVHQLVDGVEIGLAWALASGAIAVTLAIAAHSIPLVAALLLVRAVDSGRGTAVLQGLLLAAATGAGAALGFGGAGALPGSGSWLPALLAGLLVHVLWHSAEDEGPQTSAERSLDFGAAVAGLAAPLVLLDAGHDHDGEHGGVHELLEACADLFVAAAPAVLIGLAAAAAVQAWRHGRPVGPPGPGLRSSLRGVAGAVSEPLCAVSAISSAERMHRRGAAATTVVAFVLAAELGPVSFLVQAQFLGVGPAGLRWGAALIGALVAAWAVARFAAPSPLEEAPDRASGPGLRSAFDETLVHLGPLLVAGVVVAALIEVFVVDDLVRLAGSPLRVPALTLAAAPTYVSSAAASPVAAGLWAKGLGPEAALTWLLVGPATNPGVVAFLVGAYGRRAALMGAGAFVAVAWAAAALASALFTTGPPVVASSTPGIGAVAAVLLALLLGRSMWQAGAREWLGEIAGSGAGHRHVHDHDHDHDAHGHGHHANHGHHHHH